jgi:hypothetical protein
VSPQVPPPPGQPWPPQGPSPPPPQQAGAWQQRPWPGQAPRTNGLAIASLVLGIVGLVFFVFLMIPPILALIFGLVSHGQIRRSGGAQTGSGMAVAGIVMGIIGILLFVLLIAAAVRPHAR